MSDGEDARQEQDERLEPARQGPRRLRRAQRDEVMVRRLSLDQMLPEDHEVRSVWAYCARVDLSRLVEQVQAVEGGPGQAPVDPHILLALWMFATLKGVGSARQLAELCREHIAYQWLCGGVSVNYHGLAAFRSQQGQLFKELLCGGIARLLCHELVSMARVSEDGMRVRASAGASSFHTRPTLEQAYALAREQFEALTAELEASPAASRTRQEAARERAARERLERLEQALVEMPEQEEKKAKQRQARQARNKKKGQAAGSTPSEAADAARVSSTEPRARVMKMGNGGFQPAHNVGFAQETAHRFIVAVQVTNAGSDQGLMRPMVAQVEQQYGQRPAEWLVDGGFRRLEDIVAMEQQGTMVYTPTPKPKTTERDRYEPRPDDAPEVAAWRTRMGTEEGKEIYKERASSAEWSNAMARNRGLRQFNVRGLEKVEAVATLFAVVHNFARATALGFRLV